MEDYDSLVLKAMEVIKETNIASTASLQRHLNIGYGTAAKIMEELEIMEFVGPADGENPRRVFL